MKSFTDQMGELVRIPEQPRRIISLVPSQTELLFDLGLEQEVVGITKFCVRPENWFRDKTKIGGTKKFWFDKIDELRPDVILGNKEENYLQGIVQLKQKYPVWMSDVVTLDDARQMISGVGGLMGRDVAAAEIIEKINCAFETLKERPAKRLIYMIWKKPWMGAGHDTFIHTMLTQMGMINCLSQNRYPELSIRQIQDLAPELIMLSSEPYPFQEQDAEELKQLVPQARILLVDGEMFSWFGSRLCVSPAYFNSLSL